MPSSAWISEGWRVGGCRGVGVGVLGVFNCGVVVSGCRYLGCVVGEWTVGLL